MFWGYCESGPLSTVCAFCFYLHNFVIADINTVVFVIVVYCCTKLCLLHGGRSRETTGGGARIV